MSKVHQLRSSLSGLPAIGGIILPIAAAVVTLVVFLFSFTTIDPGQVAVRVNNLTGGQEAITQPGLALRVPMLHSLHVIEARPQSFSMKGSQSVDALNVTQLTVRASDGSNFHFDEFTLIFQIKGDEAVQSVRDAGIGDGYLEWMKPFARSVLRDEFGRESTIDVSDPSRYGGAASRSKDRLNEILGPHGILVSQLVTPRPKFNEKYESAIEQRNALGNQLEVITSNLRTAETARSRELAEVDQQQNKIIQERRAALESELAEAVAKQAGTKRETDTYRIETVAQGQASLSASTRRALELQGELDAMYSARKAEIDAFRTQPVERVMERLGERLKGITIDIQPWANDATPSRVKLDQ